MLIKDHKLKSNLNWLANSSLSKALFPKNLLTQITTYLDPNLLKLIITLEKSPQQREPEEVA
jgi:hypothetical protein